MKLFLKEPTIDEKYEYIKYQKEEHNIDVDYEQWLDSKVKAAKQIGNIDGKVPRTIFFLTDGKEIYGQVSIRHNIDEIQLKKYIGHIGYEIRKKYRNKGYGNLILKLALERCCELGLSDVMISCKKDNIASAKVIKNNGGVFSHEIYIEEENKSFNIYWIKISK